MVPITMEMYGNMILQIIPGPKKQISPEEQGMAQLALPLVIMLISPQVIMAAPILQIYGVTTQPQIPGHKKQVFRQPEDMALPPLP